MKKTKNVMDDVVGFESEEHAVERLSLIASDSNWTEEDVKTLAKRFFENKNKK